MLFRIALMLALLLLGCNRSADPVAKSPAAEPEQAASVAPYFEDVAVTRGINFVHADGRSGKRYYIEVSASGGGWLDYDNDGDPDLYLVNGAATPGAPEGKAYTNALYENRDGVFVDVTEASGTGDGGYGQGMCVGDVDGNGFLDIYVTNFGRDALYLNHGDGTFHEASSEASIDGAHFGTGCAMGDVDGDGDLDIYVANYVSWTFENNKLCGFGTQHILSYCRPDVFRGQTDLLYINQGNGSFREEGAKRGIDQRLDDRGFGVIISDVDNDGDPDIMVANDGSANRLYLNEGKGVFQERGELAGLAYNGNGESEAGMGLAFADVDGDGLLDQFVSNYSQETNTFYHNEGGGLFADATGRWGLSANCYNNVAWGVAFADFDRDGLLDLALANGHLMDNIEQIDANITYAQPNQLMRGSGARFEDVSLQAGPAFTTPSISRGLALADFDGDGRLDLLITNNGGRPHLLHNQWPSTGHWLGVRLQAKGPNRQGIGARLQLLRGEKLLGTREIRSGGSFLSQHELSAHFGLGEDGLPLLLRIRWPDGQVTEHDIDELDRYLTIAQP